MTDRGKLLIASSLYKPSHLHPHTEERCFQLETARVFVSLLLLCYALVRILLGQRRRGIRLDKQWEIPRLAVKATSNLCYTLTALSFLI